MILKHLEYGCTGGVKNFLSPNLMLRPWNISSNFAFFCYKYSIFEDFTIFQIFSKRRIKSFTCLVFLSITGQRVSMETKKVTKRIRNVTQLIAKLGAMSFDEYNNVKNLNLKSQFT